MALLAGALALGMGAGLAGRSGQLDPTFGNGGIVKTHLASFNNVTGMAIQRDDKIVVVGTAADSRELKSSFLVLRYLPYGDLDQSFADSGVLYGSWFGSLRNGGCCVVVQEDGKILIGGRTEDPSLFSDFAIARTKPDGEPDLRFGTSGSVRTDLHGNNDDDYPFALAIQPDGRILLGGTTLSEGPPVTFTFAIMRYKPKGRVDRSFGVRGLVETDISTDSNDVIHGLALQQDNKIVAVGFAARDIALARYEQNGALDPSFGRRGIVTTHLGPGNASSNARAVAIQPDGKIVIGGTFTAMDWSQDRDFLVARYNPDGSLDPTFGDGGVTLTDLGGGDEGNALVLQADGAILLAGTRNYGKFAIVRYTAQGIPDPSFGTGGIVLTGVSNGGAAFGIGLQSSGRIVAAGDGKDVGLAGYLP